MSRQQVTAFVGMVVGVAATSLAIGAIDAWIDVPNLSIPYLVVVLFCAVTWGWWNALGAAVLAFLAYDFFFVEPIFTFTIRDPEEWLALLIFLVVAAVTSHLAARERARREQASRQARAATLLYDLSQALALRDQQAGLHRAAERLMHEFALDGVVIARCGADGRLDPMVAAGEGAGALGSEPAGRVFASPGGPDRPGRWIVRKARGTCERVPVANFPLRSDGQQIGMLRLVGRGGGFEEDETRLLATIADRIRVSIVDHGPGIPPGKRDAIFGRFYRLDRRSQIQGSGLGLAVTRGLVEGHDGRIWVAETPVGGATFVFELPWGKSAPVHRAPSPVLSAPVYHAPTAGPV